MGYGKMSNYPNGFRYGVNVRGMPLLNTYGGNVYWVDSGTGSDGNKGSFDQPFATLDYAIGRCTANNGDIIMLKPGHSETIAGAGGVTMDVAGVTVVGLGCGADRPTFNFTATDSTFLLSAAGCVVENCLFTGGIDAVVTMFTISAADCALVNCETRDVTGEMVSCITTTDDADRFLIEGHFHNGAAGAGGANWLEWVGGDACTVRNVRVTGNFSAAAVENKTTATTNALISGVGSGCYFENAHSNDVIIEMVSTSTGFVGPNLFCRIADDTTNITEAIVGDDMNFMDPIMICNANGERGLQWNGPASSD